MDIPDWLLSDVSLLFQQIQETESSRDKQVEFIALVLSQCNVSQEDIQELNKFGQGLPFNCILASKVLEVLQLNSKITRYFHQVCKDHVRPTPEYCNLVQAMSQTGTIFTSSMVDFHEFVHDLPLYCTLDFIQLTKHSSISGIAFSFKDLRSAPLILHLSEVQKASINWDTDTTDLPIEFLELQSFTCKNIRIISPISWTSLSCSSLWYPSGQVFETVEKLSLDQGRIDISSFPKCREIKTSEIIISESNGILNSLVASKVCIHSEAFAKDKALQSLRSLLPNCLELHVERVEVFMDLDVLDNRYLDLPNLRNIDAMFVNNSGEELEDASWFNLKETKRIRFSIEFYYGSRMKVNGIQLEIPIKSL